MSKVKKILSWIVSVLTLSIFFHKKSSDGTSEETSITESVKYAELSDEDKSKIVEVIRPIIKGYNNHEKYVNLCKSLSDSKVLKTFAGLSDDKMALIVKLTQNTLFNQELSNFVKAVVLVEIRDRLDDVLDDSFDVKEQDGNIIISKII